jgi:hypothetical protein
MAEVDHSDLLPADMPHLCTRGSVAHSSLGVRFWASTVVVDGFHTSSLYRTALNVLLLLGGVYRILPMPHDIAEERRSLARLTPSAGQSISALRPPTVSQDILIVPKRTVVVKLVLVLPSVSILRAGIGTGLDSRRLRDGSEEPAEGWDRPSSCRE